MKTTSRIKITMKTFTFTSPAIENCVWSIIILMLFCSLLFFFAFHRHENEIESTGKKRDGKTS